MSIDLTLERIETLLSLFEPYTRPTIHIAGTNGKGSVSALLTSICIASGLAIGRFNSPHLVTVSDSVSINDSAVDSQTFDSVRAEVKAVNEKHDVRASSFEVLTVTALLIFERARLDVVVLEVGMGGRLDATNVIPDASVLISVITSIDLDHTGFLGSTVTEIAREKAGIIRPGRPVVLSAQQHSGVDDVVREVCRVKSAPIILAPVAKEREWDEELDGSLPRPFSLDPFCPPPPRPVRITVGSDTYDLLLPLHGDHQLLNVGTSMTVVHTLVANSSTPFVRERLATMNSSKLREAVRSCTWPGRLSFHSLTLDSLPAKLVVLADGAHNEGGARMLASYVHNLLSSLPQSQKERGVSLTYIIGLSHSPPKTPSSVLLPLLSPSPAHGIAALDIQLNAAFVRFTPPDGMPWVKCVQPSVMADIARDVNEAQNLNLKWNIETEPEDLDETTENRESGLSQAFRSLLERRAREDAMGRRRCELVIVAGSLYLVADLYRLARHS